MVVFSIVILLAVSATAWGQIEIEPSSPVWGEPVKISVGLDFPRDRLYQGDTVFAVVDTIQRGLFQRKWAPMKWDGEQFVATLALPEGCEWASATVYTSEKWVRFTKRFTPLTPSGTLPPGALIAGMTKGGHSRDNWKVDIETDLAKDPKMWWAYAEIWIMRSLILRNISPQEILNEVRELETKTASAELLRTLAYGYWLAGKPERAFETLTRLCLSFPESPYAVQAVNEAHYQIFRGDLDEMEGRLKGLFNEMFNRAPTNRQLTQETNATWWIYENSEIDLAALRAMFRAWTEEDPENMLPYFLLANALDRTQLHLKEAEERVRRAIELSYVPRPYFTREYWRGFAYRLRSKLRAQGGDFVGALSDTKMAQLFTLEHEVDDLDAEAELWNKMGYPEKTEEVALQAYRKGSLKAESFLEGVYRARAGTEVGFKDYFVELIGEDKPSSDLSQSPSFKMETLDGHIVDSEALQGEVVIVNF